jgi:maltooligosyltrehalose trehalohydrolase
MSSRMDTATPAAPTAALRRLGAILRGTSTSFRVWAPDRRKVEVVFYSQSSGREGHGDFRREHVESVRELDHDPDGYWAGVFDGVPAGALYKFRLDGEDGQTFPDPASRYQPFGVHGPSQVVDPASFGWTDAAWAPPSLDALVIYELHVGTFSPEGTFRGAMERLPSLVQLGVTAIELMPIADFAGNRNWGYDGVALFAPARCYGTPDDMRRLVDAAHAQGLAVFLDVVYNHFGPDGAYANVFSPHYFTDAHESPWGRGVNLDGAHSREVRRFFIENAVHWVAEYHVDGLRLDATHALLDDGPRHFLVELASTVRAQRRTPVYFVAEDHRNLVDLLRPQNEGGYGLDGAWADDFHHQIRVHTARDREGYYADFTGSAADLARTIEQGWFYTGQHSHYLGHPRGTDPSPLHPRQFVICVQNHDQVGNRADGARLTHQVDLETFRAVSTLLLLAPQTPLLFMGQEWAATSPFLYFTDYDEDLGRQITEGRREEFSSFEAFGDPSARESIPDPQSPSAFARSRLQWAEAESNEHAAIRRLYTRLLALRRTSWPLRERQRTSYAIRVLDRHTLLLDYRSGALVVVARLSGTDGSVEFDIPGDAAAVLTTEDEEFTSAPRTIDFRHRDKGTRALVRFRRPGALVLSRQ